MRRLLAGHARRLLLLLVPIAVASCSKVAAPRQDDSTPCCSSDPSYSTTFPATENPISEGGRWIAGGAVGVDWRNVETRDGHAFAAAVAEDLGDNLAVLTGPWGTAQAAQGTVYRAAGYTSPNGHEVELLLNFEVTRHNARGYEILWSLGGNFQVMRWNGPKGDFTELSTTGANLGTPADGDVLRVERSGNEIAVHKNGVLMRTADLLSAGGTVWTDGAPGIGFYAGTTLSSYAWADFSAWRP